MNFDILENIFIFKNMFWYKQRGGENNMFFLGSLLDGIFEGLIQGTILNWIGEQIGYIITMYL